MRKIQLYLLICTTVFATGCPKPQYRPSISFDQGMVDKFNAALKRQYREYECYRFGPTHVDFQGTACTGYVQNLDNAKGVRNELIENALSYIDESYNSFVADIQAGRDRNNFLLDLVDLSTAATVGITNGERTLQIIGVALTAFRGGRKSADANFYKDTSTPILISKMDGNRAKVRALIVEREGRPAGDYSLGAAVSDIVDYYNAGTLVRAFTQLQQDTAIATEASEKALTEAKKAAGVKGAPSPAQLKFSKSFAQAVRDLRKAYKDASAKVKTADTTITTKTQDITNAGKAITDADQRIGAAEQRIVAANAKPTPNNTEKLKVDAERTQAEGDKSKAEGDKAKAEASKTKAEADRSIAESARAEAIKARDEAFTNIQSTFEAIAADSKLSPVLDKSPGADPNITPARRATLQSMLDRLREKKPPESDAERDTAVDEYATILLQFGGIITEAINTEPELSDRLQEIMKTNK